MLLGTSADSDLVRHELERTDLGNGLARLLVVWRGRESPTSPFEDLGTCHVFQLQLGAAVIEIEIDTNYQEWRRNVHILFPDGTLDISNTALQLWQLRQLLNRPEVGEAIGDWTSEDKAAERAEQRRKGAR
jgi:hypothetical protein